MKRIQEISKALIDGKETPVGFRSSMVVQLSLMPDKNTKLLAELIIKGCKQYNVEL